MVLAIAALWAHDGRAQNAPHIRAELIVAQGASQADADKATLAVHFRPEKGWHGYWENPGDAGLGGKFIWDLPVGWTIGAPRYPMPKTLMISGLMNHVYDDEYAVLFPVTLSAGAARAGRVNLRAQWLACTDRICVPESAELSRVIGTNTDHQLRQISGWKQAIPPQLSSAATFDISEGQLRIAIPLPAEQDLEAPHLFVGASDLVSYAAPQKFWRSGDRVLAVLETTASPKIPAQWEGLLRFGGQAGGSGGAAFTAMRGTVPPPDNRYHRVDTKTLGAWEFATLLLGAFFGGILLNLMPCVFPILSLKALSLARSGESETTAKREATAYSAGVIVSCLALGGGMLLLRAAGAQIGWAFQLQNPFIVVTLLLIAGVVSANLLGVFELPNIVRGDGKASAHNASAFSTGILAAVAATPCTGPFMAAAMGAALVLPAAAALALFSALGLGIAAPFLAIGFVPRLRAYLPRPGAWMARFRKVLALPMLATTLALVWLSIRLGGKGFALIAVIAVFGIVLGLFVVGKLQRAGKMAWPAFGLIAAPFVVFALIALPFSRSIAGAEMGEKSLLEPQKFSAAAYASLVTRAKREKRPIFLWFTADWCLTCKVNEKTAIERSATKSAFNAAGVLTMRGDWTRGDPAITNFLEQRGAAGVPLYVWITPDGRSENLPQILTQDMLIARAHDPR